ncbi:CheY-like chemotaxis protein [Sagittula marina]|uniref:CheY-like chemotaxis protein n=1 Tax=Sagittula marina TaxID=943940 RepID=A0A7W6DP77_9RHOB|nr:response regulator [Sagittula marina]MBB3986736.1 CheY-like chemotaxis protein [Sagittula marina]
MSEGAFKIFIADDNQEFANFCAEVARKEGWIPTVCCDGLELLRSLEGEEDPVLIICDLNMPHLDGIAVAQALPEKTSARRIRFITGGAEANALAARLIADARDLAVGRFLLKPISVAHLREILEFERAALSKLTS